MTTQQAPNICIAFVQSRLNVFDVGPTLYKYYTFFLCLLHGKRMTYKWLMVSSPAPLVSIVKFDILPKNVFFKPFPLATTLLASPSKRFFVD